MQQKQTETIKMRTVKRINRRMRKKLKKPVTTENVKTIKTTEGIQETRRKHTKTEDTRRVHLDIRDITNTPVGNEETARVTRNNGGDHHILLTRNADGQAKETARIQNIVDVQVPLRDTDQATTIIGTRTVAEQVTMIVEKETGNVITAESGIMKRKTQQKRMKTAVQRLCEKVKTLKKN